MQMVLYMISLKIDKIRIDWWYYGDSLNHFAREDGVSGYRKGKQEYYFKDSQHMITKSHYIEKARPINHAAPYKADVI